MATWYHTRKEEFFVGNQKSNNRLRAPIENTIYVHRVYFFMFSPSCRSTKRGTGVVCYYLNLQLYKMIT